MNITPSPRILRMLGEIEFYEWQCIAELVDNAFDDFSEITRGGQSWPGGFKVSVTLPTLSASLAGGEVVVRDTGSGMSRERLENAVTAGWSSNDRFDKLGLFGMGFNVSTARLGRRTRVLTTRAGDPEWIGVEIDLDTLGEDFEALDITEAKDDPSEHGTRIEISRLNPARADWFGRHAGHLRTTLGSVYGWLLDNTPYELWVGGVKVNPRRACRWGDDRYVIYGAGANAEKIPAYIKIDERYSPADSCEQCGNWQSVGKGACDQCGSNDLRERERRLHGWLGIQRHLDRRDFGVDFLRNGRKILQLDKQLFNWADPNSPTGAVEVEYPIELVNQGGRIIGEIHLDHVPVHYDKTAFEYSDRQWKAAVDFLRGVAPLQPQKARNANYPENTSPLALLYKGFRRNAAGVKCLIPGDGSHPLHDETRQWALKFWAGDPDYQSDQKWYDQAVVHDERQGAEKLKKALGGTPEAAADELAVLAALGLGAVIPDSSSDDDDDDAPAPPASPATPIETVQERLSRYISEGAIIQDLSREFGLPELGRLIVETRAVRGPVFDEGGARSPILLARGAGGTATALVDTSHDAFVKLGTEPAELLLTEISAALKVSADSDLTLSQISSRLRAACLPDTAVDPAVIRAQATELLVDVRQRMADNVEQDPERALSYLDADEQTLTQNALIAAGGDAMTARLADGGGRFMLHVPPLYLVKVLESWPEAFMEGRVFSGPYTSLPSPSSRRLSLARVVGYLNDIATLMSFQSSFSSAQLRRTRLSLQLLQDELAPDST